ncbi:M48 family metalloprotease [Actinospica sp. MGRD01-02]|uniref:M48 family metalloprotease n=1 Tax=Actinospica acidithermotolerans TaxID=2828514 RepID=A0A941EGH7_9ACTN|nr:M48 family metallopeptidase [Actinospica acidithermotolerans]MBR7830185.1 M48 family metalloprotease [Actinospica acidithermotolerans]
MPDGIELRDFRCPKCAETARLDPRFVQWCTSCGYNADPKPPELGNREVRRLAREYERSRRLFESLRTASSLRPTTAVGLSVTVLSGIVHLMGICLLVLPILLVVAAHEAGWSEVVLGICVLTFLAVGPRLPRRVNSNGGLDRASAPRFYELLDRCAAELGCAVPDQVRLGLSFNASTGRAGIRQRSYLLLGVPLWTVLSGQERIALLGHELAHQVNGDTTHGLWAASARRSLHAWTKLLDPRQTRFEEASDMRIAQTSGGGFTTLAALLTPAVLAVLFAPLFAVAVGCQALLGRLDLYCGQRAEYLADELGAQLAGSEALLGLLVKLGLAEAVGGFLTTSKNRSNAKRTEAASVLWPGLAEYVDSIPDTERRRRELLDRLRNTRTDVSHPANHLRIELTEARPRTPGVLKLSEDEWAAIDAELAPGYASAARGLLGA